MIIGQRRERYSFLSKGSEQVHYYPATLAQAAFEKHRFDTLI